MAGPTSFRQVRLLNGWWDFQPVLEPDTANPQIPNQVPSRNWASKAYLVPGFFTDHYYPDQWRQSRSGWARTRFTVADSPHEARFFLTVRAAIPQAHIFLNGRKVAVQDDMFIGEPMDVTEALRVGENELAIFLTEFPTFEHPDNPATKLIEAPWGCCIATEQAGIWQDVQLEARPAIHIEDVTIRTSVREAKITVITTVRNASGEPFAGTVAAAVEDAGAEALVLPEVEVCIEPGATAAVTQQAGWASYRAWCPHDPYLYHLRSEVRRGGQAVDVTRTRFGFREVWIEGHRIMLNGVPQRWAGEWCHKAHAHWLRPEYVRQWYRQILDLGGNYVRMHTFPHPEYFLDIADEMGLLVCQETALHGSYQRGHDSPQLWQRARDHVRRMVRRDKNHPSLVLWSVENEMRWALNIMPSAREELPKLRALFNELDPTRPAYHDGDSSLWNEDAQEIISRHYGTNCHGLGWWDKRRPLHAGEVGRWHYGSPYTALIWANDEVFADYAALSRSIAADAARIVELGRANEVSCLFIWNTSGLDNLRPKEARKFRWDPPESRYAKPLAHKPYESEYAWWQEGSGYRPGFSFEIMRRAFRKLAVVVCQERNQFYLDRPVPHSVWVVNDLPQSAEGLLEVRLEQDGRQVWQDSVPLTVKPGCTEKAEWEIPLSDASPGSAEIVTVFRSSAGTDEVQRVIGLTSPEARTDQLDLPPIAVWGDSAILPWLEAHGVTAVRVGEDVPLDVEATPILVVGERVIEAGSQQNARLREFLMAGGRVLVLEQVNSPFPGLAVEYVPTEIAHLRDAGHPVLSGIAEEDLRFFGDDPYGLPSSDSWVTVLPYVKPTAEHVVRPIIDSSGGDFGTGGLRWAPVIEARIGAGCIIASQLRLTDRLGELPVADRLLRDALAYLSAYQPTPGATVGMDRYMARLLPDALPQFGFAWTLVSDGPAGDVCVLSGEAVPEIDPAAWAAHIAAGNTVIVWGLTEPARRYWEAVTGVRLKLFQPAHPVYQLIAPEPSPLLAGLSNEDTCWLDNWPYRPAGTKNPIVERLLVADGGRNHLENATRSCLDRLFGDDRASEWLRMPTVSECLDGPPPRVGGGLVEVPVGDGRVIFCQILWRPDLWQFRRFLTLLLWNLGVQTATDILAGTSTPSTGLASEGFPTSARATRLAGDATLDELISISRRQVEHLGEAFTFREWPGWDRIETPDGLLSAEKVPGSGRIAIGLAVRAREARKLMQTLGGLPNPDLQTFLRLEGSGNVKAWVNGVPWAELSLQPGVPGYVSDIDFEAGVNCVLVVWRPDSPAATLRLLFENKDRRRETTFAFV